jgi:hypothetical protein
MNLFILFSTNFTGQLVKESLKFISVIIGFFQNNNVFTSEEYPDMKNDKLIFEIFNLNFLEQNNLWASMGAKYVPSILYKVRMIVIEEGLIQFEIPEVGKVDDDKNAPKGGSPFIPPPVSPLMDALKDAAEGAGKIPVKDKTNSPTASDTDQGQNNLVGDNEFDEFANSKT